MPYGTVNADVIQTSTSGGILGAGNASIMKNRFINGGMTIAQRGTSAVTDGDAFPVDRWATENATDGSYSAQQSSTAPAGFNYSTAITITAADTNLTTTQRLQFYQKIEGYNFADFGWGTADAKTVTLSFWVRSSLTGTFGGALMNSAQNRSYPYSYTISAANTWEYKSVTITGDTTGTWLTTNGIGCRINWGLGVGPSFSGTANTWAGALYFAPTGATSVVGTSGATFYITGVQLEVGSSATGFEYVNYQTSLANCQRYYWQNTTTNGYYAYQYNATNKFLFVPHPVTMRTTPTATVAYTSGSFTEYNTDTQQFKAYVSSSTADTTGYSTTSAKFSAEL